MSPAVEKWAILASKVLSFGNIRSMRSVKNWRRFVKMMANRHHAYELRTVTHMIEQIEDKNAKVETMHQIGKWLRLVNGIRAKNRQELKVRHMEVCGRWSKLARKLLVYQAKLSSLNAIGKWGYLTEVLLKKSVSMKYFS